MRVDADSMDSIRMATALIEGPGLSDERRRQIAEVIRFAQRMVSVASRVRVHTRHAWPSATASNEESGRWVELLAGDDEFRLEFWESRTTLERPDISSSGNTAMDLVGGRQFRGVALSRRGRSMGAGTVPTLNVPRFTGSSDQFINR
jgi:hypothetical protein